MKVRLHLDQPLAPGQPVALSREASNYLFAVLRLEVGAQLLVFNGQDGEFAATVTQANKKNGALMPGAQTRPVQPPPDLWLCFAPIKRARAEIIVEKAVELGVARLVPVLTDFTNAERLRPDKLRAQMIEAAEQCEAVFIPDLAELQALSHLLDNWPDDRRILWADEARDASHATIAALERGKWAVLIGPEGGFSAPERARLRALPFVTPLSLGPRILRAETAAIAALALWQAHLGDWT
jgi:16S rRNA (uracil1498-N3)-methyltransferase